MTEIGSTIRNHPRVLKWCRADKQNLCWGISEHEIQYKHPHSFQTPVVEKQTKNTQIDKIKDTTSIT